MIIPAAPAKDGQPARSYSEALFLPKRNLLLELWTGAKLGLMARIRYAADAKIAAHLAASKAIDSGCFAPVALIHHRKLKPQLHAPSAYSSSAAALRELCA